MNDRLRAPLRRSSSERMIAGVCGGIAEWGGWDPTLVRVLYIIGTVASGLLPGVLAYVIFLFVIPETDA